MPSIDAPLLNVRPRFRVDGQDRPNLGEAVLALDLRLPRSGMAGAEVRVLNWSGSGSAATFVFNDIRLGQRLELFLGEGANTTAAFSGDITALEERYGDGAPQLVLLAEDGLHRLARRRTSRAFEDQSLDDVIRRIASDAGLQADVQAGSDQATWLQNNESDLAFLLRQLEPRDIGLRLQDGRLRARDDEADPRPARLTVGANAEKIRLIADLNHQVSRVQARGYDLAAATDLSGDASSLVPAPAGVSGVATLGSLGWNTVSTRPHPAPRTAGEANDLARKGLRQSARRFVHGEIVCRDTPDLRGGREVELVDASPRLAGRYRVMDCHHRFDASAGLRTHLRVERPDLS